MILFFIFAWLFGGTCVAFWVGPELRESREQQEERARQQQLYDERRAIRAGNGLAMKQEDMPEDFQEVINKNYFNLL